MRFYTQQHKYYCGIDLHVVALTTNRVHRQIPGSCRLDWTYLPSPIQYRVALKIYFVFCPLSERRNSWTDFLISLSRRVDWPE